MRPSVARVVDANSPSIPSSLLIIVPMSSEAKASSMASRFWASCDVAASARCACACACELRRRRTCEVCMCMCM